jgi:Casein kinase II regulatory subunit
MKHEEICNVSRLICKLSYCSVMLCATIACGVHTCAYSEIDHGSGSSDYRRLLPYLSDDQELMRSFYISDDEREELILKALEENSFQNLETESESRDISPSSDGNDVLKPSIARPHQLLFLPASQKFYLTNQRNFSLSCYQIQCVAPFTSLFSKSFASASSEKQLPLRHSTLDTLISPWVLRFLSGCRRDMLLPIPRDYCADNFNMIMLPPIIECIGRETSTSIENIATNASLIHQQRRYPIFRQALKLLTQNGPIPCYIPENLERATTALYLLLHQRYVLSPRGFEAIRRRFLSIAFSSPSIQNSRGKGASTKFNGVDPIFGRCPNVHCCGMPLLPIGDSDSLSIVSMPRLSLSSSSNVSCDIEAFNFRAKRFCAICRQVFYHWDSEVDGCAWGTSFCHLFLMVCGKEVFGDWKYVRSLSNHQHQRSNTLVGKIFGFRIHPSAFE